MPEHSRTSKGEKQPRYINALAEKYFRLAYCGFSAKDKNFNATIQTYFAESISKLDIILQAIGKY